MKRRLPFWQTIPADVPVLKTTTGYTAGYTDRCGSGRSAPLNVAIQRAYTIALSSSLYRKPGLPNCRMIFRRQQRTGNPDQNAGIALQEPKHRQPMLDAW
jgi:hypothetical protein